MPDHVTPLTTPPPPPAAAGHHAVSSPRNTRVALLQATVIVVGFIVVAGVLGGFLVERFWTPPDGMVYQHHWYRGLLSVQTLSQTENAEQGVFAGLGWYAALACLLGLLLGALAAALLASAELVTLAAVAVGGLLGGLVMRLVAVALAPADPTQLARRAADGTVFPDTLHLGPWWTIVLVPGSAMLALAAVFLLVTPRQQRMMASKSG